MAQTQRPGRAVRRNGVSPMVALIDVTRYPVLVPDRALAREAGAQSRGGSMAGEPVLPELSSHEAVALLPDDPNEMLTSDERRQLVSDLVKLASLRRDAEIVSGSLRLA